MSRLTKILLAILTAIVIMVTLVFVLPLLAPATPSAPEDHGGNAAAGQATSTPTPDPTESKSVDESDAPPPAESLLPSPSPSLISGVTGPVNASECAGIPLEQGTPIDGNALGACIQAVMTAHNTYYAVQEGNAENSEGHVSLNPVRIDMTGGGGDLLAVKVDENTAWGLYADGWIEQNPMPDGEDSRPAELELAASIARVVYGSVLTWEWIATSPTWSAQPQEVIDAHGVTQSGWLLTADSPTNAAGIPSTNAALEVTADFTLMSSTSTSDLGGLVSTAGLRFADWGKPYDFQLP